MDAGPISFLRAFTVRWFETMSGGLGVPLMIVGILRPDKPWAIGLGFTGIVALVFASYRIWARERKAVIAAEKQFAGPNWRARDAFIALKPSLAGEPNEDSWDQVGSKVLDLLASLQIVAWGREIEGISRRRGPLTLIASGFWEGANFTYWFDEADEVSTHAISTTGLGHNEYADICFNRAALKAAWRGLN